MTEALVASNIVLWVVVLVLGAVMFALIRQIGVLHERLGPAGALMMDQGPSVGDQAPIFELRDLREQPIKIGGIQAEGKSTMLFFLSPTCPVCGSLVPMLKDISRQESDWLQLVFASDGEPEIQRDVVERYGLESFPYVLSQDLGMAFQIGKLPYAVILDSEGKIAAKGLVNSREHIDSLFEAAEMQIPSIQAYLTQQKAASAASVNGAADPSHAAAPERAAENA